MTKFGTLLVGAGLLALAGAANAQTFSYTTSFDTNTITSGSGNSAITLGPGTANNLDPTIPPFGANITPVHLSVNSTSPTNDALNGNFTTSVTIVTSDAVTKTLNFTSNINGNANLMGATTTFSGVLNLVSESADAGVTITGGVNNPTYEFASGSSIYTVNFFTLAPPQDSTNNGTGVIAAKVSTRVANVPEPGSMALLGTGLLPMAGLLRRRRK